MSAVADAPLRLCRETDPETVVGFVAGLYGAGGWNVETESGPSSQSSALAAESSEGRAISRSRSSSSMS